MAYADLGTNLATTTRNYRVGRDGQLDNRNAAANQPPQPPIADLSFGNTGQATPGT